MLLIGSCEPLTAFLSSAGEYFATVLGRHALSKSVRFGFSFLAGLKCSFHTFFPGVSGESVSQPPRLAGTGLS